MSLLLALQGGLSQSILVTLEGVAANVSQTLNHIQGAEIALEGVSASVNQIVSQKVQYLAVMLDDVDVSIAQISPERQPQRSGGGKFYVKRNKQILIFDTLEEANAFAEAEELAQQAIEQAQKTSRRARKRVKTRFVKDVAQPEVIELDLLSRLVKGYAIPVDFPKLIQSQDLQTIAAINLLAMQMQDEEEIEFLLMS
jgi:hypothetical protein